MTLQITFQDALKLLNQKEEDLLEQTRQVRERKTQLLGALKFLGILELLDFPEHPLEEDKKDTARTRPETIDYFGQTGFARDLSKLSRDPSDRAEAAQRDSIYERAFQKAWKEITEAHFRSDPLFPDNPYETQGHLLGRPYRAAREIFRGPQGPLNAQRKDPSEWLLEQANASCDEILAGSTTLQELLDNLDKLGGVRFNQDIIRDFLAGLSKSDSIDQIPSRPNRTDDHQNSLRPAARGQSSLSSVDGYRSTTEEIRLRTASRQLRRVRVPALPDSLMELRPDFRKTANLGENMERVGTAAQGKTLNTTEVAKLLIHQGLYRAKMGSLRYRVRAIMQNNPLQYQKIDEDTFLFISPIQPPS